LAQCLSSTALAVGYTAIWVKVGFWPGGEIGLAASGDR
jgi:hypothetical protein